MLSTQLIGQSERMPWHRLILKAKICSSRFHSSANSLRIRSKCSNSQKLRNHSLLTSRVASQMCNSYSSSIHTHDRALSFEARSLKAQQNLVLSKCWTGYLYSRRKFSALRQTRNAGLFGLQRVQTPEDLIEHCKQARHRAMNYVNLCVEIGQEISQLKQSDLEESANREKLRAAALRFLTTLDLVSDVLCSAADPSVLCRDIHADKRWRNAAQQVTVELFRTMRTLNTSLPLYEAVCTITKDSRMMQLLTSQQQTVLSLYALDFEREGIHMPKEIQSRQISLHAQLDEAMQEFNRGLHKGHGVFFVSRQAANKLPVHMQQRLSYNHSSGEKDHVLASTDDDIVSAFLHMDEPEARQAAYHASQAVYEDNIDVLHRVIKLRAELASLSGFERFGDYAMAGRMTSGPEEVMQFARDLGANIRPKADLELKALQKAKYIVEYSGLSEKSKREALRSVQQPFLSENANDLDTTDESFAFPESIQEIPIYPWDVYYYINLLKKEWQQAIQSSISPYLTLKNVIRGLQLVVERVFGIEMIPVPLASHESWANETSSAAKQTFQSISSLFHHKGHKSSTNTAMSDGSQIFKFVMRDKTKGVLGTIYLDLFTRPNKPPVAAHYVIRCGYHLDDRVVASELLELSEHELAAGSLVNHTVDKQRLEILLQEAYANQIDQNAEKVGNTIVEPHILPLLTDKQTVSHALNQTYTQASKVSVNDDDYTGSNALLNGRNKLPVVSLVMNFMPRSHQSSQASYRSSIHDNKAGSPLDDIPLACLSFGELETVFHEFGHALHSMLSETDYQHVSGTRTVLDFVEVPSHLFEYFARDPRVLAEFAHHHETGEPIQPKQVEQVLKARRSFGALSLQSQILHTLLDQVICTEDPASYVKCLTDAVSQQSSSISWPSTRQSSTGSDRCDIDRLTLKNAAQIDTKELLYNLQRCFWSVTPTEAPCSHGNLMHLLTHEAGYYTYLYARRDAGAIWHRYFAQDPFCREAGDAFRKNILAKGGSENPSKLLRTMMKDEAVTLEPFLKDEMLISRSSA